VVKINGGEADKGDILIPGGRAHFLLYSIPKELLATIFVPVILKERGD
jgi:hypothetical protein